MMIYIYTVSSWLDKRSDNFVNNSFKLVFWTGSKESIQKKDSNSLQKNLTRLLKSQHVSVTFLSQAFCFSLAQKPQICMLFLR